MTDTTTTTDALVTPGTLTLVTISADYFRDDYRTWNTGPLLTEADDIGRTFYAAPSTASDMVLVVEPRSSDRSVGMWSLGRDEAGVRLEDDHGGWNVPRSVVTPFDPTPDPDRPVAVGDRVRISDDHPAEDWRGLTGTVTSIGGSSITVEIDGDAPQHAGQRGGFFLPYFTRLEDESTPDEGSSSSDAADLTYVSAADHERLVAEAVAAAKREADEALEAWKEHANGIAVQYAKDNELCGNFERCMADIGLMGREEWDEAHKVTRRVTFEVDVEVTADADDYATKYEAAEWLADRYASTIVDYATDVEDV